MYGMYPGIELEGIDVCVESIQKVIPKAGFFAFIKVKAAF
jgi:hypothetical protein